MKNYDAPAMPTSHSQSGTGLTKREYFAAMAMQGLLASNYSNATGNAKMALINADAMLAELDVEPQEVQKQYRATEMFTMLKRLLSAEMPDELRLDLNTLIAKIESQF